MFQDKIEPDANTAAKQAAPVLNQSASSILNQSASSILNQSASSVLIQSVTPVLNQSASPVLIQSATPVLNQSAVTPLNQSGVTPLNQSVSPSNCKQQRSPKQSTPKPRKEDPNGCTRKKSTEKKPKYTEPAGSADTTAAVVPSAAAVETALEAMEVDGEEQNCWIAEEEVCPWEDE